MPFNIPFSTSRLRNSTPIAITQPFRLLDLPTEILHQILQECIGVEWVVYNDRMRWFNSRRVYVGFSFNNAILQVSRHIHKEVLKVITLCKNGTYIAHTGVIETEPREGLPTSAFFDDGITTIKLELFDRDALLYFRNNNIAALKSRFRYLQYLHLDFIRNSNQRDWRPLISRSSLLSILTGMEDPALCTHAERDLAVITAKAPEVPLAELLCGITVYSAIVFPLSGWCTCTENPCILQYQNLSIAFSISSDGCRIREKTLNHSHGVRFKGTKVETAIAVLEGRIDEVREDLSNQTFLQRLDHMRDDFEADEDEP